MVESKMDLRKTQYLPKKKASGKHKKAMSTTENVYSLNVPFSLVGGPRSNVEKKHKHSTNQKEQTQNLHLNSKTSLSMETEHPLNQLVYVPDPKDGYALGRIVDLDTKQLTVQLEAPRSGDVKAKYEDVVPAVEDQQKDVNDNCSLMYLNEGTLLHNCRLRYARKQIYTYVANILISINPYEQLEGLYSSKTIEDYRGKSLGTLSPHIFAIADKAYREMRRSNESQSIIVSGESGAGKTECQKFVLRYLCENWSSSKETTSIEQLILEANPILEAFGNAKTLRNNNSSRFGKFVEIHFGSKHEVVGGYVSHYLLEKSRIISQAEHERNYHVFFQLIAGAEQELADKLGLKSPDQFKYLNKGCTQFFSRSSDEKQKPPASRFSKQSQQKGLISDEMVDDFMDFQHLRVALKKVGIDETDQFELFRLLAGILHLGNIEFETLEGDMRGGCNVTAKSKSSLDKAAEMLGLDSNELRMGLTTRFMQPTRSGALGTLIQVRLKESEAQSATNALAKAIYSRLFDHIVTTINSCIPFGNSEKYIGVLDIAGFEFFKLNSFEQFCINYTNEKLQKFFNDRILKQEQELYASEHLNVPRITYSDNQDCIELFESKGNGLLELLNEEARLPRASVQHFTTSVCQANNGNKRLLKSRNVKEYREFREDECFIVRHYAADVCYQTAQFLEKNNDSLHASLETLVEGCSNSFVTKLFNTKTSPLASVSPLLVKNKLAAATVSSKFRSQLNVLIQKVPTSYVASNQTLACLPGKFDGDAILSQLRSAGMGNVLRLMQMGYPSRTPFSELYDMYAKVSSARMARLDPRLFCRCIFHALGLNDVDFKFGVTKVFFRSGKFAQFDQLLRRDPAHVDTLIQKAQSWLNLIRWKKVVYVVLACVKVRMLHEAKIAAQLEAARLAKELEEKKAAEAEKTEQLEAARLAEELEAKKAAEAEEAEQLADQPAMCPDEFNVSSWSYAKLRDTINMETDIALINACRCEFRRRLAVYRQFKLANAKYKHSAQ
ncbi:Myosin motor domain-containing protein [Aphelenchoides bicaudatus]|nr:Myosin motor domain-containing protein [Aphelenchoides bicaudatus]